jgi:uncharacterized membrane protein
MSKTDPAGQPERLVHWTLLWGVALSGLLLSIGLVITLVRMEARPEGLPLGFATLLRQAMRGNGLAMVELGLLALMVTPILRVAVLAIEWTITGKKILSAVSLTVLGLLLLSFLLGVG